jgi:hypothetical protein
MVKTSRGQSVTQKGMIAPSTAVHGKASPMRRPASLERTDMTFSLDTPSAASLKAEAKALRQERALAGVPISHGAALEEIAHRHGYRDWNTASAALPERVATPVQVGQRVKGTYLGRSFVGMVIGVQLLADMRHYQVIVKFDRPVDVSRSELMGPILRQRVTATVDLRGISPAHTSDGEPHMRLSRA